MALYRTVSMSFWTDPKVTDDFTPEDRYFYLYLFTNPHTNLCGCYEVSIKQMSNELGYNRDTIEKLIERFEKVHKVLRFSEETKEILLLNWSKYNWTSSEKFRKPLSKEIEGVKNHNFKEFLNGLFNNGYRIDTTCIDTSVTDTVTYTVSNNSNNDVDFEKYWNFTFDRYPKKSSPAVAKQEWMNKILATPEDNQKDVAKLIWQATEAYLADYEKNNPNDKEYRYIPKYSVWLKEDCDYWISVVEKGE